MYAPKPGVPGTRRLARREPALGSCPQLAAARSFHADLVRALQCGAASRERTSWTADSTARSYDAALTLDAFANRLRDEATLAYRRLLDRFGKRTQKLGHLHHTGEIPAECQRRNPHRRAQLRVWDATRPLARYLTAR